MDSERIHPLSKPQAIAAMAVATVLVLGGIWKRDEYEVLDVVALYLLVVAAILLIVMVTPTQAEYVKGSGERRSKARPDLPLVGRPVAEPGLPGRSRARSCWRPRPSPGTRSRESRSGRCQRAQVGSFPLAIATGVLVVAYFGLALQYFLLRFGGRGRMYFALFLFLAWVVPLVAGTILSMASMPMRYRASGARSSSA